MVIVAMLIAGAFALLTNVKASNSIIWGVVRNSSTGSAVRASVTLVEAHGGFTLGPVQAGADGYFQFSPGPGRYFFVVRNNSYFDNVTERSGGGNNFIVFDGSSNVGGPVLLDPYPTRTNPLSITTEPLARVTIIDATRKLIVDSRTADVNGTANFTLWTSSQFYVMVNLTGMATYVSPSPVNVGSTSALSIALSPSVRVAGTVLGDGNLPIRSANVRAYLVDTNSSKTIWKRLIPAVVQTSDISFDAYPGTFILVVDADGYTGQINQLTLPASGPVILANSLVALTRGTASDVATTVVFRPDWNSFSLYRNVTVRNDGVVEGLAYGYLHDAALQVDLAMGNGDGTIQVAERNALWARLNATNANNMTTDRFLTLDGRTYVAGNDFTATVPMPAPYITYQTSVTYTLASGSTTLPTSQKAYFLNVTGAQASSQTTTNYTYRYLFRSGYERTTATVVQGTATVTDFRPVVVTPAAALGYARVNLALQTSAEGTAYWKVVAPTDRFYEWNSDLRNYSAVVAKGVFIQLSAEDSTYGNAPDGHASPEFNYTWKIGQGAAPPTAVLYGQKPSHYFNTTGAIWVDMTLRYPDLNTSHKNNTLTVDGAAPAGGAIQVTFNGATTTTVDEKAKVRFTPTGWTDPANFVGDTTNGVRRYDWDFNGDGTIDQSTTGSPAYADYSFPNPGIYNVTLTVVDYAGNKYTPAPVAITVRDVTKPTVGFQINDPASGGQNLQALTEGVTYSFDGSKATTDNYDQESQLTFTWSFGDGTSAASGDRVTHAYAKYGTYTISLQVTDRAGNKQWNNRSVAVAPQYSARPDVAVTNLQINPTKPQESTFLGASSVTISITVTNNGDVAANDISIYLLAFRQGETAPKDGTRIDPAQVQWFSGDTPVPSGSLAAGQSKRAQFTWSPGAAGNWTIRVNASDSQEPSQRQADNVAQVQTDVYQASWKTPAIYGTVAVVVVGLPALFFLRRRMASRAEDEDEEDKGGRLTRRQRANRRKDEEDEEEEG